MIADKKKKVLVLGASGLLGASLVPKLSSCGYSVISQSRGESFDVCFDPTKWNEVEGALEKIMPQCIVNTVASTDVDECDRNAGYAYNGNVRPAIILAGLIKRKHPNIRVVNVSTDHLYNGNGCSRENDVSLINEYAYTKYAAELILSNVGAINLRTNIIGKSRSSRKNSFTDWLFTSFSGNLEFSLYVDSFINPLHMDTLSEMVVCALESEVGGAFNVGSHGGMSKAEIGECFADLLGMDTRYMRKTKMRDSAQYAPRPFDMRTDVSRWEMLFDLKLPSLESEISKAVSEYKNEA